MEWIMCTSRIIMFMDNWEQYTNCTFTELIAQRQWYKLHIISITDGTGSSTDHALIRFVPRTVTQTADWNIWSHIDTDVTWTELIAQTIKWTAFSHVWCLKKIYSSTWPIWELHNMTPVYCFTHDCTRRGNSCFHAVWSVTAVALKQHIVF